MPVVKPLGHTLRDMNNFPALASAALANAEDLVPCWLPDGKRVGAEWVALNPTRADGSAGSFSVNLRTGKWADFATGDKGGDLISLLAYIRSVKQGEAAAELASMLGIEWGRRRASPMPRAVPRPPARREPPTPSRPTGVPAALPDAIQHPRHGPPVVYWKYHDADGCVAGLACRFETPAGKEVVPFSWNGKEWGWQAMPEPRPVYRLPLLLADPAVVVLVVEGEKAADAAATLIPEAAVTTWAGGCKAWSKTDWRPLAGRKVILWPDADDAGIRAMNEVCRHLLDIVAAERVNNLALPNGLPAGWDGADCLSAEWTKDAVLRLLRGDLRPPLGCCLACWMNNVIAPVGGPTCPHANHKWPRFPSDHPDQLELWRDKE